jgi:predicted AAA+ superfamily ATPase
VVEYVRRVVDGELDQLFSALPAVAIEGPRAVGKTATAERRATTVFALDDPAQRELLAADPGRIATTPAPVLLDEWQRLPESWDVVRRSVDADRSPGRFLLTGSASPPRPPTHSGAGRIVTVRMRPMALSERGLARPTVSLGDLLRGARPQITGSTDVSLDAYTDEIVRSGFPGLRHLRGRASRAQLDGWLDRVIDRDVPEQGRPVRRPRALRAWLTAYAAATGTSARFERIRDAATPGEHDKPAKQTTMAYRDVLTQLWVLDPVPGWLPTSNRLTRLSLTPKHHLADPALAARLLGVDESALLSGESPGPAIPRDGTLLGALFESLVALSVRVYAQAAEASVCHLRTSSGDHEVDLIVQRADQRLVALEVKLAASVAEADVRHLRWLQERVGPDLLDAAVITTGVHAYRRPDGIAVIPAALLGE